MQDLNLNRLRVLLQDSPYNVQFSEQSSVFPFRLQYHTTRLSKPLHDYSANTHVCQMILAYMKEHGYSPLDEILKFLQKERRITRYYTVVTVTLENGDSLTTECNGSIKDTVDYYYQGRFNFASCDDTAPLFRVRNVSFQIH
jgi:hypothetical protein